MIKETKFGFCADCGHFHFKLSLCFVDTGPGESEIKYFCSKCKDKPHGWEARMGIVHKHSAGKEIGVCGTPHITGYGHNAYGSVLAVYDNGARLAITCQHGGSGYLCLECAKAIVRDATRVLEP
ncbi:MAG: hypothetical protein GF411_02805 [Candidatus Lokiarchaeota archaeon]|nr:hypothetical protein [Candidatus Lokiarchaeota archaeon]